MPASVRLVKLERGRFSSKFQVARACISAASALMAVDPQEAKQYLSAAIKELALLHRDLGGVEL
jgi:hypothetical protein